VVPVAAKQILGIQFYRQKPIGNYSADFYAPAAKWVIELDGAHHLDLRQAKIRCPTEPVYRGARIESLAF
jgi:very-short-patch-repair endonuclease